MFDQLLDNIQKTSLVEWIAIATATAYVVLAAIENAWCWVFGFISCALYSWIFYETTFYLDAGLQIYYCAVAVYAWTGWRKKESGQSFAVHRGSLKSLLWLTILPLALAVPFALVLKNFTPSQAPWADALLTMFSLSATWMTSRKILESWLCWIVIDAAYVVVLGMRSLPMTAALYAIYTIIAAGGYFSWRKQISR